MSLRMVSESVPRVTGQVFSRKYIALGRVVTHWREIIGPAMAGRTQPVKINYRKKKGEKKATATLDIAVTSADASRLHYQTDLILERINRIFGDRWITAIRFVHMPSNISAEPVATVKKTLTENEKNTLSGMLEKVGDPEIRDRLQKLGTGILTDDGKGKP